MKKITAKLIAGLLILATLVVMSGCGGSSLAGSDSKSSGSSKGKSFTISESVNSFNDGFAWITVKEETTGVTKRACIDTKGKIQFILNDIFEINDRTIINEFQKGYAVIAKPRDDTVTRNGSKYIETTWIDYIIDKSGKIVWNSEEAGFDAVVCYDDGYFVVSKKEKDSNGENTSYSIIDSSGNILYKDCLVDDDSFHLGTVLYKGDDVFCCENDNSSSYDVKCVNAKSKKVFNIDNVDRFYNYNNGLTAVTRVNMKPTLIIDNEGNILRSDLEDIYLYTGLTNDSFICSILHENGLYKYDLNTKQMNKYFDQSQEKQKEICDYCDEGVLFDITDEQNNHWSVFVDYQGEKIIEPIKGTPNCISCDRIIVISLDSTGNETKQVYDFSGKLIEPEGNIKDFVSYSYPKKYEKSMAYKFTDNYIPVTALDSNGEEYCNYMDINGKLLFKENNIKY